MRFVTNGPDIPDRLIWAHEQGDVVFFCGAGISLPSGLLLFGKLTKKLYEKFNQAGNFKEYRRQGQSDDVSINVLGRTVVGGRQGVCEHLTKILQPDLNRENALSNHRSLLTLASKEDQIQLVTTNFDRIF